MRHVFYCDTSNGIKLYDACRDRTESRALGVQNSSQTHWTSFAGLTRTWPLLLFELGELCCHCRVPSSKLLDCYVLGLVVCQSQIPIGSQKGILCLLQVIN